MDKSPLALLTIVALSLGLAVFLSIGREHYRKDTAPQVIQVINTPVTSIEATVTAYTNRTRETNHDPAHTATMSKPIPRNGHGPDQGREENAEGMGIHRFLPDHRAGRNGILNTLGGRHGKHVHEKGRVQGKPRSVHLLHAGRGRADAGFVRPTEGRCDL